MPSFYRYDGFVITPSGPAVPGASIAVLQQPANFTSRPGTPLQQIYAAANSNSATITAAFWNGGQIAFTFSTTPPADVVVGSYIGVSGVTPTTFNTTVGAPYLVVGVSGNIVTVASSVNPGAYVSGGTVSTSTLPNPTSTDGNGNYFFYVTTGIYSIQIYSSGSAKHGGQTITERDLIDQAVGVASAGGSVNSVALALPNIFTVSGSPVTSSGTLTGTLTTQSANMVFAGPTSGPAATPTFRALTSADFPAVSYVSSVGLSLSLPAIFSTVITGSPVTTSGTLTGTVSLATQAAKSFWAGPTSGSAAAPTFRAMAITDIPATGVPSATTFLRGDGTWSTGTSSGGVTSVAMTGDGVVFNSVVSGSPVTGVGTLAPSLKTQTANLVFAGPSTGSPGAPTFRALVTADLPAVGNINWVNGEVPTGSGTAFALAHAPTGLVLGFRNVSPMKNPTDFTISGVNITLAATIGTDTLLFWYTY